MSSLFSSLRRQASRGLSRGGSLRLGLGLWALALFLLSGVTQAQPFAQLPAPELFNIAPLGGQAGTVIDLTLTGQDLDGASQLLFSHPGLKAEVKKDTQGKAVANAFSVTIAPETPVGLYDVRVVGKFGISNPRSFWVGKWKEKAVNSPMPSREKPTELDWDTVVNTTAIAGSMGWYRLHAGAGEDVHIALECPDTRLEPVLTLANSAGVVLQRGRDLYRMIMKAPSEGDYFVEVHDLMFRGGADYRYRLILSHDALPDRPQRLPVTAFTDPKESERVAQAAAKAADTKEENEVHTLPLEKIDLFPANGRAAVVRFRVKKGEHWCIDLASHRLGYATDASMVLEEETPVVEGAAGTKYLAEDQDFDLGPWAADYNLASRDGAISFDAKEDGILKLSVRDLFNTAPTSPRLPYRLAIRKAEPDFSLVAMPDQPPRQKVATEVYLCPTTLRRNGVAAIRVLANRQDGFAGDVELTAEGLPPGVQCLGATLRADQDSALLTFVADNSAPSWGGMIHIQGQAHVGDAEVTREATAATMEWNVGDTRQDSFHPRMTSGIALGVVAEEAPVLLEAEEAGVIETGRKDKLALKLKVIRRGNYHEPFKIRAMGLMAPDKLTLLDVPADVDHTTIDLDLGRLGLSAGEHEFVFQGVAPRVKYRKNAEDIPVMEAEAKQRAEESRVFDEEKAKAQTALTAASGAPAEQKAVLKKALDEATKKAAEAEKVKNEAAKRAAVTAKMAEPKDLNYMIWSKPIRLRLTEAAKK